MPTYVYQNTETGEIEEHFHKISEMDSFLEMNTHLTRKITIPNMIRSSSAGHSKPDSGFRDVLKSIKSANRGSNINTF